MIVSRDEIKSWFVRLAKPKAQQFAHWLDSFVHKDEMIPLERIEKLDEKLQNTASNEMFEAHLTDKNAHKELFDVKVDKEKGKGLSSNDYNNEEKQKVQSSYDNIIRDQKIKDNKLVTTLENGEKFESELPNTGARLTTHRDNLVNKVDNPPSIFKNSVVFLYDKYNSEYEDYTMKIWFDSVDPEKEYVVNIIIEEPNSEISRIELPEPNLLTQKILSFQLKKENLEKVFNLKIPDEIKKLNPKELAFQITTSTNDLPNVSRGMLVEGVWEDLAYRDFKSFDTIMEDNLDGRLSSRLTGVERKVISNIRYNKSCLELICADGKVLKTEIPNNSDCIEVIDKDKGVQERKEYKNKILVTNETNIKIETNDDYVIKRIICTSEENVEIDIVSYPVGSSFEIIKKGENNTISFKRKENGIKYNFFHPSYDGILVGERGGNAKVWIVDKDLCAIRMKPYYSPH